MKRLLFALCFLGLFAAEADAGLFRRGCHHRERTRHVSRERCHGCCGGVCR